MRSSLIFGIILQLFLGAALIPADAADNKVIIGILGDQSGVVADVGGRGAVTAAKMAVADFGGTVLGRPIEIRDADHLEKVDVAASIAQKWFDVEGVDAIADLPNTGVVLALQEIARTRKKTLLVSGAASVEITGKYCSPFTTHWTDDTFSLANGTARVLTREGADSWFFLTADYSFGYDLERDAAATIKQMGGRVLGSVRFPLNTHDFSSYLLQAQASGAKIIGLASAGGDTINAIKQAGEFGIERQGQRLAALHAFISDVHSLGQDAARGLVITSGFYWNDSAGTRQWSRRFFAAHGQMPTREQAGVYLSVLHYLKGVQAAGTTEAAAVNAQMRRIPIDRFGTPAGIRPDGRVTYDIGVYEVMAPSASREPWDYYRKLSAIPADQAFRPIAIGGCLTATTAESAR